MELEHLDVRLIETKASDDMPGAFTGYGAVFGNEDAQGDVIRSGAFGKTLTEWKAKGKLPPMLLNHGGMPFGVTAESLLPVGQWTEMDENSRGLKVSGQLFALGTERGQYIYEGLKSGALDGLSIGYSTRDALPGRGGAQRTLIDVELHEVSIVTFPANPKANILTVKSLSIDELRELEDALRDAGLSRTDSRKAVAVLKQWPPRDAGAPNSGQRDAAAPDAEAAAILAALDRNVDAVWSEVFRR